MHVDEFFDKTFVINRDARPDRWEAVQLQLGGHAIRDYERVRASEPGDAPLVTTPGMGCNASHVRVLREIVRRRYRRALVIEDDACFIFGDFRSRFDELVTRYLPNDWDMLYLSAHYAERPIARVNSHIIRAGRLFTTAAYAVTGELARLMLAGGANDISVQGLDGRAAGAMIDQQYMVYNVRFRCYVAAPRLVSQAPGPSDIQRGQFANHHFCLQEGSMESQV